MSAPARPLLAVAVALALAACGDRPARDGSAAAALEAEPPVAPVAVLVETRAVERAVLTVPIEASGEIRAQRISGIGAEVGGRLLEVLVDVGDTVEAGALLFRIDPEPYRVALAEARAALNVARAERDHARQERSRVEALVAREVFSELRGDEQRTATAMAEAQVAMLEARLERARSDLARTEVRAPYAATVVERRAHEGEMVGAEPVAVLQESGAFLVVLHIPEATPVRVRRGDPLRVHVEGLEAPLETRIDRTSDRIDPATRTYEVRAPVASDATALKAGAYARAEIEASSTSPRAVIDRSALVTRDGRSYVVRVEEGQARRVPVRIGATAGGRVEILGGLEVGEAVVVGEATGRLAEGDRVRVGPPHLSARADDTP
jgi:RND family efflux transporter MFP subunit